MTCYVALVRAANVGGTGKLPMAKLKAMCEESGFSKVRTYIASGNVVFISRLKQPRVRALLEEQLAAYAGKPVPVIVRTAEEMAAVLSANPFRDHPANSTVAIFFSEVPPADAVARASGGRSEQLALGVREIYVAYGERMADSKLRIPGAERGTARNMNTIAKLAALARSLEAPAGG